MFFCMAVGALAGSCLDGLMTAGAGTQAASGQGLGGIAQACGCTAGEAGEM